MKIIHKTHDKPALTRGLTLLLALGTGLAVACLYYTQPMLGLIAADLHLAPATVGGIPTLTQLGYALGILLLTPLGDWVERRRLMVGKALILSLILLITGTTQTAPALWVASFAIGLMATLAQDLVPTAAALAAEARRGQVIGTVMTGLLLGILLSRTVAGFVAAQWGWRTVFYLAAGSIGLLALALYRFLPALPPSPSSGQPQGAPRPGYGPLMRSLWRLWRAYPALRRATLAQALQSMAFSAFWSTLALILIDAPFHQGSAVAGAFGLAGAAGALAAPLAGRAADRLGQQGPERLARLGTALTGLSFAAMSAAQWLPAEGVFSPLAALALGAIGFDLGVQISLISHQTIVYGLQPDARSRLNALLVTGLFIGMAIGSAIASQLLSHNPWPAVTTFAALSAFAALGVRLWPAGKPRIPR